MNYIITLIIILGVLGFCFSACIFLVKHVLFHPMVNSVIVGIFYLYLLILLIIEAFKRTEHYTFWLDVANTVISIGIPSLVLMDCIWDIVNGKQYYCDFETRIDKEFMVKSLSSIPTFGLSRLIFLCIVRPIRSIRILLEIKKTVRDGYPVFKGQDYYQIKWIRRLEEKGVIVSNIETLSNETKIRQKKLDALYPKKTLEKVVDMVAGDKVVKEKRKDAEMRLRPQSLARCCAYLSADYFERYPKLITEVMSQKGCHSVSDIKKFDELKSLHLTFPFYGNNSEWSEYFIIQALKPLVIEGTFEDDDLNDNDVFDNHAYRCTKSKVAKKIIDADNNPLLALDD